MDDMGVWNCDISDDIATAICHEDFGGIDIDCLGSTDSQFNSLDVSDTVESSQGLDLELTDAEAAIIQLAQGKITGSRGHIATTATEKVYVTHEDFEEGPERDAFLLIYGYAENLFNTNKTTKHTSNNLIQQKAINFFFCRTIGGLHLEDAVNCIDDSVRVDVMRLRFMLEFWIRGWELPAMPATADPLPSRVETMAASCAGIIGIKLAREAWFKPGIDAEELLSLACDDDAPKEATDQIKTAFNDLVCAYILSINQRKVYTTGKNPILELQDKINDPTLNSRNQLANMHWSRRF